MTKKQLLICENKCCGYEGCFHKKPHHNNCCDNECNYHKDSRCIPYNAIKVLSCPCDGCAYYISGEGNEWCFPPKLKEKGMGIMLNKFNKHLISVVGCTTRKEK